MSVSTRSLLRLHRYAGLIVAPMVLFFAVTGTWQLFRLQQDRKDGSYKAPPALHAASDVHMAEDLPRGQAASLAFKATMTAVAVVLALSTLLGIVVALRMTRPTWLAVVLLALGAVVPPLLYLLARSE
jgi:hypothetical protein